MNPKTLAERIAEMVEARRNCQTSGNTEWYERHGITLKALLDRLPSGSGWDRGTTLEEDHSGAHKLVFTGSYHHMNDGGYYYAWTDHAITARPSFLGLEITVSGRDRNQIKEYLSDLFHTALADTAEA
jgi:hypothetical protein